MEHHGAYLFLLKLINTEGGRGWRWRLGEVRVGQSEGVERRVAPVVPQQLVLQKPERLQREHNGFVLEEAVHVEP